MACPECAIRDLQLEWTYYLRFVRQSVNRDLSVNLCLPSWMFGSHDMFALSTRPPWKAHRTSLQMDTAVSQFTLRQDEGDKRVINKKYKKGKKI